MQLVAQLAPVAQRDDDRTGKHATYEDCGSPLRVASERRQPVPTDTDTNKSQAVT